MGWDPQKEGYLGIHGGLPPCPRSPLGKLTEELHSHRHTSFCPLCLQPMSRGTGGYTTPYAVA